MNQVQGGGSKVMSFGKSRAKRMSVDSPKITFRDVAGVDEAVEELHEIKEFLENPKKFQALGARIPKGVLLYGPPGTGKTLLARAVAGEAGVPFFSISGSDFVEMFVGVGASRVRDLFEQAKQNSPVHHLHGRDRRRRPPPRRRPRRRSRRARADAQPAAGRDGRLRDEGQHHPDRRHQPARHPRPGAAAPGPLRPPDRRRPARPARAARRSSRSTRAASRWRGRSTSTRWPARRPASPAPICRTWSTRRRCWRRATASARSPRIELEEGIMRVIAGPEKKTRVMSNKERQDHRLPRDGPRDRRPLPAELRPDPQDLGDLPRPGARLHDLAARRGQVPDHPRGAPGHDGDDARRPRRRGDRASARSPPAPPTTSRRSPRPPSRW